jgi:4-diphosphocytidyl-2-C-methyl-D-erythritol kinase
VPDLTEFCPAKINPYLAVTGKRADGFHELVSVVSPVSVGDTLEVTATRSGFALTCDDPDLPTDGSNLVMKAAEVFRQRSGWSGGAEFHLRKVLPAGAGLGGGSSDAVAALRALNRLAGNPLDAAAIHAAAAEVGSDCPLFLADETVVMTGRGENVQRDRVLADRLRGRSVLICKPNFGINTTWAYGEMARRAPDAYRAPAAANRDLQRWQDPATAIDDLGFNSFTKVVGSKFPAIPVMVSQLAARFDLKLHLSGSGSACFGWWEEQYDFTAIAAYLQEGWGDTIWIAQATCH